jgi:hypothetical protein
VLAVARELVVEMRAGREAGRADVADHLAALDLRARHDGRRDRREMPVGRRDARSVVDADVVAEPALPARHGPTRRRGGPDRRAVRRREVDAPVRPPLPADGVEAIERELRRDLRELDGIAEEVRETALAARARSSRPRRPFSNSTAVCLLAADHQLAASTLPPAAGMPTCQMFS